MKTKMKKTKIIPSLVSLVVGGLFGFLIASAGVDAAKDLPVEVFVLWGISFLPVIVLVIAAHEAGHAVAGISQNFDFRMFVVGPFMWDKEQHGWKFKWNKNVNVAGGMVICLPRDTEDLKKRFMVYGAGGPLASLLLTVVGYVFHIVLPSGSYLGYLFLLIALLSFLIFVVTIIPMQVGGFTTDGGRILNLLRGGERAQFETLLIKLITQSTAGVRPALLNWQDLVEADHLGRKLNSPFHIYIQSYFFQSAWDKGDLEMAHQHLLAYVAGSESIPKGLRGMVWLDAALFFAVAKQDYAQARTYWQNFIPSAIIPKAQIHAVEAALLLEENRQQAAEKIDTAVRELPNMLDRGAALALHDLLLVLKGVAA
jgi:hypothetical protein